MNYGCKLEQIFMCINTQTGGSMEKIYKTMNSAGKFNLISGIFVAVTGIFLCVCSAFMIVNGAKLIARKKSILF